MEQEKINHTDFSNIKPKEIDITAVIIKPLWRRRKFIFKVSLVFMLIGLFIALFSPVQYTATCTVVPQSGNRSGGGSLNSVASIMGINLGTAMMSEGALSPSMYTEIIKSVPFTQELMKTNIIVEKSNGNTITLYEYYANEEYRSFNIISFLKRNTIGIIGVILNSKRDNKTQVEINSKVMIDSTTSVFTLTAQEKSVYNAIQRAIQINSNPRNGSVVLSYTFPEPYVAAILTDRLYRTLEEYVSKFKSEKLDYNLDFVELSYETARNNFLEAQTRLSVFQDANRGLITASARSMETQLRNEHDIAFTLYRELATQREQAKIAVKENQTILTLVNPPVVPHTKSAPNRSIILIGLTFIGISCACIWTLIKPYMANIVRNLSNNDK